MGLDMWLAGRKYLWPDFKEPKNDRKEDGFRVHAVELDLAYWRKHPDLHGFIVQAFADGRDECQDILLDESAIRCVISAVKEKRLPLTTGFFFGESSWQGDEQWKEDVAAFERALAWLEGQPPGERPSLGEELPMGDSGLVMRTVKMPEAHALAKETRSVVYRASW